MPPFGGGVGERGVRKILRGWLPDELRCEPYLEPRPLEEGREPALPPPLPRPDPWLLPLRWLPLR